MVTLEQVRASNADIKTRYPRGLVAVFAGATSGIGETSLREFVRHTPEPRVYIIGRSQEACDRLDAELRALNPGARYHFIRSTDLSLLRNVDEVCDEIRRQEKAINVLFMSQGGMYFGKQTEEGLNYVFGLTYFGRLRMMANLLPLLQKADGLRRVVSSFGGANEGKVWENDWQGAKEVPMRAVIGHMATMVTLGMEALAEKAPEVSFIHDFPGALDTNLIRGDEGGIFLVMKYIFKAAKVVKMTPGLNFWSALEVGERHVFYCTSAKYPPRDGAGESKGSLGVPLQADVDTAGGTDGKVGSGMYSINKKGESVGAKTVALLEGYRKEGVQTRLWQYTESQFRNITGTNAF